MNNWKYTDATNRVVARTNENGSSESCLVEAIADWLSEGNTPEPADPSPQESPAAAIERIEQAEMLPRPVREFMLEQPGAAQRPWYAKIKALDDQIATLRAKL